MPQWAQDLAYFLPFMWTFYFPIQALVGDFSTAELLGGLAATAGWTIVLTVSASSSRASQVRQYAAVGT